MSEKKIPYGTKVTISGEVVCNDGSKFEDYSWEEHLQYLGFALAKEKDEDE